MKDLLKNIEQTRILAANPDTTPEVLEMLEKSSDRITREAVANNPNTPTDVLLRLGAEFPEQLLNNPLFSLLLLENINFVAEIPFFTLQSILKLKNVSLLENINFINKIPLDTLQSILRQKNVSSYILEKAADKAELKMQLALVNNCQTSKEILNRLTQSQYIHVAEFARLHVNLAGELTKGYQKKVKQELQKIVDRYSPRDLEILAQIGTIPEPIIQYWIQKSQELCKTLAQSKATHPDILKQLAVVKNINFNDLVCMSVAERSELSNQVLKTLTNVQKSDIRKTAMKNPNLTKNELEKIICGEYASECLQHNPNFLSCNPDSHSVVINHYAKSVSLLVRFIALHQPQVSQKLLQEKINSIYWLERFAISQNPNTTTEMLLSLAEDSNQIVRAAAEDRLKQLESQEQQNN